MYGLTAQEASANVVESYDSMMFQGSASLLPGAATPGNYAVTAVNSRSDTSPS